MIASKLSSALVAPSKVANLLDWRKSVGSVMSLEITKKSIGIAVSVHPEHICESIALRPILLREGRGASEAKRSPITKEIILELEAEVRRHRVCAFVVNWPVHEGRMGEQCGKVLSVLDSVIDQSNSVITRKRPFTLWTDSARASYDSAPPDEWGRCINFAKTPEYYRGMNYSSKEVVVQESSASSSAVAANVLDEWVKNYWEIDIKMGRATSPKTKRSDCFFDANAVDRCNSETAYLQAALL
ncbi:hypothetical protein ACHAW5_003429 [Stephanodiscus triporus]|uniref:Uncharacterized protein n=1 Tax=Stephanodiscus triporus TaxID=2934178 RepID=A0ABD3P979_9STRA